jgi:hypothetical protein
MKVDYKDRNGQFMRLAQSVQGSFHRQDNPRLLCTKSPPKAREMLDRRKPVWAAIPARSPPHQQMIQCLVNQSRKGFSANSTSDFEIYSETASQTKFD